MSNLRCCPFCGEADAIEIHAGAAKDEFWVACGVCKAEGPPEKSFDSAVEVWNKRKDEGDDE